MKPVNQTIFKDEQGRGNCLQACIASLLELPLEDVPHFTAMGEEWWFNMRDWFAERNLNVEWAATIVPFGAWHIASVVSPRFDDGTTHAVICNPDGEIVHDPHPDVDDPSINSDPIGYYWLYPIDPAKMVG